MKSFCFVTKHDMKIDCKIKMDIQTDGHENT